MAVSTNFYCVLRAAGDIECAGGNTAGQLGSNVGAGSRELVRVPLPRRAVAVDVDIGVACAVLDDGSVWCWGDNSSAQLGRGFESELGVEPMPIAFSERSAGVSLASGMGCVWTAAGSVACWGHDVLGRIHPEDADTTVPALLPELEGASSVAAADHEVCALMGSAVWCRVRTLGPERSALERRFGD